MVPWGFDANWAIAHGCFESSVTVETPECPIAESHAGDSEPLVLKPSRLDSGPCEIKICFRKKYDICQIYVRSTARVYEVYYSHSPQSSNEYLCTVRCNAAERDEKLLQTTGIEYVSEEHDDCFMGELLQATVTDQGGGDDDWVKIKVPVVDGSSLDKTNTNSAKNVQDLYEATAQISDAEPCSLLTIRFLSLQNKSHVYVDEVYVFADLAKPTDSANEAMVSGISTGSSLMTMVLPALLQSARSGIGPCVKGNHASEEKLKDDRMEIGLRITKGIDVEHSKSQSDQQCVNILNAAPAASAELQGSSSYPNTKKSVGSLVKIDVGSATEQVDQPSVNLQELDKDAAQFTEPQQPTSALNTNPMGRNDMLQFRLESALEQLISRVSRVEDICLRLEEKLLRPIESMESRIQHIEIQLQKLTESSLCCELPLCTRISAPAFSCSESDSKSLYEGNDCPQNKVSLCDSTSNLFLGANFRSSLVGNAPEFSYGDDEEDDDTPCIKPRETLSIDDALAAALSGFMSAAKTNPSDHVETISSSSSFVDEKIDHCDKDESRQKEAQEISSAQNCRREPSQFTQIRAILNPNYTLVENDDDEHVNDIHYSSDAATVYENKDHDIGMIPSSIQRKQSSTAVDSCDFNENKNVGDFGLTWDGNFPVVSTCLNRTCIVNLDTSDTVVIFESNTLDSSCERGVCCNYPEAGDLVGTCNYQSCEEANPRETNIDGLDDQDTTKQVVELESGCKSLVPERYVVTEVSLKDDTPDDFEASRTSTINYELPILDVEFTFSDYSSTGSPLEALLDGVTELNTKPRSIHDRADDDGNAEQIIIEIMDNNETTDLLLDNSLLVDLVVLSEDVTLSSLINQEMICLISQEGSKVVSVKYSKVLCTSQGIGTTGFLWCCGQFSTQDACRSLHVVNPCLEHLQQVDQIKKSQTASSIR